MGCAGVPKKFNDEELDKFLEEDPCKMLKELSDLLSVQVLTGSKLVK